MAKPGQQYEILVQTIFQQIVNQDQIRTIDVRQNVTIQGKTTSHQIDVYWKFDVNGIEYLTIVQAKDWESAVNQGALLQFKAVLDDIPGQPRGIFVTKTGYQVGAANVALNNGILLFELRRPTEEDFEGRIRTIDIDIIFRHPRSVGTKLILDNEWINTEYKRLMLPAQHQISVKVACSSNELILYDENRTQVSTLQKEIDSLFPVDLQPLPPTRRIIAFPAPRYIKIENEHFPWIKIKGYETTIEIMQNTEKLILKSDDFIHFILRNVQDGTFKKFDSKLNEI